MIKKFILLLLIPFLIQSCGLYFKNKTPKSIRVEAEIDAVNYGIPIPYRVYAVYSNGKTWNISNHDDLAIHIKGGSVDKRNIIPIQYPTTINDSIVEVDFTFTPKQKSFNTQLTIPFNYKGTINLDFNGANGAAGETGKKGKWNSLTRNGKAGENGGDGNFGENGNDLVIHVWQEKNYYHIRIQNLTSNQTYRYKTNQNTDKIIINARGGNGGDGGDGGKGGDGKDGEIKKGKTKPAGDGGNGGDGGQGGNGGHGGNVFVYIHENAIGFQNIMTFNTNGGIKGEGGNGNTGGDPGKALPNSKTALKGGNGNDGYEGIDGNITPLAAFEITTFEFSDF